MKKNDFIKMINRALEEPWTLKEVKQGRDICFLPGWKKIAVELVPLYVEKGWKVDCVVSLSSNAQRQFFLNFKNPTLKNKINY